MTIVINKRDFIYIVWRQTGSSVLSCIV